jgi:hypothetical protein
VQVRPVQVRLLPEQVVVEVVDPEQVVHSLLSCPMHDSLRYSLLLSLS